MLEREKRRGVGEHNLFGMQKARFSQENVSLEWDLRLNIVDFQAASILYPYLNLIRMNVGYQAKETFNYLLLCIYIKIYFAHTISKLHTIPSMENYPHPEDNKKNISLHLDPTPRHFECQKSDKQMGRIGPSNKTLVFILIRRFL